MRAEFLEELATLARSDERVVLVTADLGFSVVEAFASEFPDRFLNVGVAEQNMIGVATGLAHEGYTPFTYSIATFASMRPYEVIRDGPALHNLPLRMVGAGGGFDYGHGGVTHYALEDVAILRAQPNVTVVVPADVDQARAAVRLSPAIDGPAYFRVGRESSPIPNLNGQFQIGRLARLSDDPAAPVAIIACGSIAREAVGAAKLLDDQGISTTVAVVSSFNPFPTSDVLDFVANRTLVMTVEAHYRSGGLGSAVAETLADAGHGAPLIRMGITEMPVGYSGSPNYMLNRFGLTAPQLAETIRTTLKSGE